MKKTLFTSMLALCMVGAALAEDDTIYTFTSNNYATAQAGGFGAYSSITDFVVSADSWDATSGVVDSWSTTCDDSVIDAIGAGFTTGTTVSLDSITLYSKHSGTTTVAPTYSDGLVMVITYTNAAGEDVVIKSDSLEIAEEATSIGDFTAYAQIFTFDAEDAIIIGQNYTITFETSTGDSTSINISVSQSAGGTGSDWYVGPNNTDFGPVAATVVTSTYTYVPEPATASLSFLALAGLMIRRRRKA